MATGLKNCEHPDPLFPGMNEFNVTVNIPTEAKVKVGLATWLVSLVSQGTPKSQWKTVAPGNGLVNDTG